MTTKVTFTFDEATINRLNISAQILKKPKSEVVREAIRDYHLRIGKLSESERIRRMRILERIIAEPPTRPQEEADREIREIRRIRRLGGRRMSEFKYQ